MNTCTSNRSAGTRDSEPGQAAGYRFPWSFVLRWSASALAGRRRSLARDGSELLAARPPVVRGAHHLPRDGAFIVAMNHYERPGMRVWWPAVAASATLGRPEVRWIITNQFYRFRLFGRFRVPARVVTWVLNRVGAVYGLIMVERRPEGIARRAVALRTMRRHLDEAGCSPVGSTPEGEFGGGPSLREPYPSSGKALAWLSRGRVPIVPVGVSEEDGHLVLQVGQPFVLAWPGLPEARRQRNALAETVMRAIAGALPPEQRGRWTPR